MMQQFHVWVVGGRKCLVRFDLQMNMPGYYEFLRYLE